MIIILYVTTLLAFSLLSLSLPRHFNDVVNNKTKLNQSKKWQFRILGYGLLLISMILTLQQIGTSLGLVYWCPLAMLSALTLAVILSYKPQSLIFIARLITRV